jgi:hypothetical protein
VVSPARVDPPNFADMVAEVTSCVGSAYSIADIEAALRSDNYDTDQACNFLFANPPDAPIRVAIPPWGGLPIPDEHFERLSEALPSGMTIDQALTIYHSVCQGQIDHALAVILG